MLLPNLLQLRQIFLASSIFTFWAYPQRLHPPLDLYHVLDLYDLGS